MRKQSLTVKPTHPYDSGNHPLDLFKFLLVAGVLVWFVYEGALGSGYNWQWYRIPKYIGSLEDGIFRSGPLLKGLIVTLQVSVFSLGLSCLFGFAAAFSRLSPCITLRFLSRVYLEGIRNTPLLVQLFFIYFVIAPFLGINRFFSAVLALSLFEGAYASEIIRAGIVSVSPGQWEAAGSIGLSTYRTYRHIILPQALGQILPPLAGQMISLIKDSALVSTIALYDLTMEGQMIIAETFMVFELWFVIAGIYLILTLFVSMITRIMEKRLSTPQVQGEPS